MDENTRQEDAMYTESQYAYGLLMYGYSRLPYMNSTTTDIATDDAVTNEKNSGYLNMATGTWAADNNPVSQWDACKDGIQYVNKFLTIVEKTSWAPSAESKQQMFIDRMRGEAFALRAIFYYHLLMAHGGYADDGVLYGVPLITQPEDASSDFNQERALFSDCIKQIFNDCDSAYALLPIDYKDVANFEDIPAKYQALEAQVSGYNSVFGLSSRNFVSGRIAQAVKAQAAVLAASPAFRDHSGVTSERAAELCAEVLKNSETNDDMAHFDDAGHVDWYSSSYKSFIDTTVPEVIWRTDRSKDNNQEKSFFPPSIFGNARVNPSQNLVDAFPMNNGLPITDPQSGYDPQNPYANRDMRLSNYIIYNGSEYKKNPIYTGIDMGYGPKNDEFDDNLGYNETKSTRTGYYLKKLLRDDVSANPSSQTPQNHIYVRIRYTEIFLGYAEAANDAFGPDGKPKNYGKSAYDIIKKIRERAGIGKDQFGRPLAGGDKYIEKAKSDKTLMTNLIRNERRLELCFENKRFWDLRRWLLPLNETVKGMRIEKTNDDAHPLKYTIIDVEKREYDNDYQCYGPIPKGELLKWSKLKQNKGWK